MDRAEFVLQHLSPGRRAAAEREQGSFDTFCHAHHLTSSRREAVTLYLTDLMRRDNTPAASLRYRLGLLDVMARAHGSPPWSADAQVRLFIRGLHARACESAQDRRVPPLYMETVRALIDAIDLPTYPQIRHAALICLAHHAHLRVCELHTLRWEDVRIRRGQITLRVRPHRGTRNLHVTVAATGANTCPAAALQRLYDARTEATGLVFDRHGTTMYRTLATIGYSEGWTRRALLSGDELEAAYERLLEPTARQGRDRAIVLLAAAAHLTTGEVMSLRIDDVHNHPNGVVLTVPRRRNAVGVPRQPDGQYCPVTAWERWRDIRANADRDTADFAFLQVEGEHRLLADPMTRRSLNGMVQRAAKAAGLNGTWGFGSLRVGAIRTAARSGTATHIIATRAGLESLRSVERHQDREALLANNVAAHLGL